VEVWHQSFLTSALDKDEWSASHLEKEPLVPTEKEARWPPKSVQKILRINKSLALARN
jgi:hypothetical protein